MSRAEIDAFKTHVKNAAAFRRRLAQHDDKALGTLVRLLSCHEDKTALHAVRLFLEYRYGRPSQMPDVEMEQLLEKVKVLVDERSDEDGAEPALC